MGSGICPVSCVLCCVPYVPSLVRGALFLAPCALCPPHTVFTPCAAYALYPVPYTRVTCHRSRP